MKKLLFQLDSLPPDVNSINFKDDYKKLFIEFNTGYGAYGKPLNQKVIDDLFNLL